MSALQIAFLNVGQGDTTIIYDLDSLEAIVVDCSNSLAAFDFLQEKKIQRVRAVIITHAHRDHCEGIVGLLENCEKEGINWESLILRWEDPKKIPNLLQDKDLHSGSQTGKVAKSFYETLVKFARKTDVKKKHIDQRELPRDSKILSAIQILHPEHRDWHELFEGQNLNNLSIVIRVSDGSSALLTGDIEAKGWEYLRINHLDLLACSVLKFPHHGAWRDGDIPRIFEDVKPQAVIISVGTTNSYGHPTPNVFAEVRARKGIRLLCTQATSQCCSNLNEVKEKITDLHNRSTLNLLNKTGGCPCAGTVIVELDDVVKVISPTAELHTKQVIGVYMTDHQCGV